MNNENPPTVNSNVQVGFPVQERSKSKLPLIILFLVLPFLIIIGGFFVINRSEKVQKAVVSTNTVSLTQTQPVEAIPNKYLQYPPYFKTGPSSEEILEALAAQTHHYTWGSIKPYTYTFGNEKIEGLEKVGMYQDQSANDPTFSDYYISQDTFANYLRYLAWLPTQSYSADGPQGSIFGYTTFDSNKKQVLIVGTKTGWKNKLSPTGNVCPCSHILEIFISNPAEASEIPPLFTGVKWFPTIINKILLTAGDPQDVPDDYTLHFTDAFTNVSNSSTLDKNVINQFVTYYQEELKKRGWTSASLASNYIDKDVTEYGFIRSGEVVGENMFIFGYKGNQLFVKHSSSEFLK